MATLHFLFFLIIIFPPVTRYIWLLPAFPSSLGLPTHPQLLGGPNLLTPSDFFRFWSSAFPHFHLHLTYALTYLLYTTSTWGPNHSGLPFKFPYFSTPHCAHLQISVPQTRRHILSPHNLRNYMRKSFQITVAPFFHNLLTYLNVNSSHFNVLFSIAIQLIDFGS